LVNYVSAKIALNKFVHRIEQNGALFHVHYWGGMPKHYNNLVHKHSFFEAHYVLDGNGFYMDDNKTYPLQANTLFLSRPEVLHQITSEEGITVVYVAFELVESESSDEWIKMIDGVKGSSQVVVNINEGTTVALLWKSLLLQATKLQQPFFEENLTTLSYSLISSLIQTFAPSSHTGSQRSIPETSSVVLNQVKLYIRDNLTDSLKLKDVSKQFHISERHLSRLFVTQLGMNYSDFIQHERIQNAATLLKTTDLTIKDIAEESGFVSVHHFTRVFRAIMRNPPGRFRSLYTNLKRTSFTDY
jgi:AraC-like DNA-binding protein/mannose-6-phosphate isomerase-like protein (cupin superfamily)